MLRCATTLLLPAMLFLLGPAPASAQWPPPPVTPWVDPLGGTYANTSGGGYAQVYPQGASYLFINENGSQARYAYTAPGRLQMIGGQWDPNVVATPGEDAYGRITIRFDSPFAPTGYWVKVR